LFWKHLEKSSEISYTPLHIDNRSKHFDLAGVSPVSRSKAQMSRNKHGPIPDDFHENDAGPAPKEKAPLDQELLDHIAALKSKKQPDES
jgi:hypothetical protein